ncbi:class I SAM-dependent methyltransferase [Bailinhaonella thermotolerans]|uniref:Class I SAM-dependent methyltransferase n=1 Tax=Bailinhaonella thermotolerans TaxID=1070861 RepID=A0A3A4BBC8_9ACTN|nr:class I SAM-dependent methyltransferase [Bailinhaonella thermotolerans]RJL35843.1 class I SAM-dependent methyltransferase [Bailinhaonella thermotolerans]
MPTLSRRQPGPSRGEPHKARGMAESFGADAERYDRARPEYPEDLVRRIIAAAPGTDILDVGCGTGIEARQFLAAGCRVLGVEPDARMAEFARRTGVEVEVATFEDWDDGGRAFDAVVAGQSWHWVDPVAGGAKAARVLRPGGVLSVFAHAYDPPPGVADAFTAALREEAPASPVNAGPPRPAREVYQAMFDMFADGIRKTAGFGEPEEWRFDWERHYSRDEWLDLLPTTGALTQLPPDALARVLDSVGAAVDALGGGFTMAYTTIAVTATRNP